MVEDISLSLEETNKLRIQLGLKPIEPENANNSVPAPAKRESQQKSTNKTPSAFIDSSKISSFRDRLQKLSQRNRHGLDDTPNEEDEWLSKVGSQKETAPRPRVNMIYDDDDDDIDGDDDMSQVRMAHNMSDLATGKDVILTLKDKEVGNGDDSDDDDVLEDENLSHFKETDKNIKLKSMNKDRRRKKMKLSVGSKELVNSDDEINQEEDGSVLVINSTTRISNTPEEPEVVADTEGKIRVRFSDISSEEDSDQGDFKQTKIKKRKRRDHCNNVNKSKKVVLPQKMSNVQLIDEDMDDDHDMSTEINVRRNVHRDTHESGASVDLATKIRQEALENKRREMDVAKLHNTSRVSGLVMDETSNFLSNLDTQLLEKHDEDNATADDIFTSIPDKPKVPVAEVDTRLAPQAIELASTEQASENVQVTNEPESTAADFSGGLASTLNFLRDRHVLPAKSDVAKPSEDSQREELLKLKRKIELRAAEETPSREAQNSVRTTQTEILRDYNPEIKLVYKDDQGHELTTKEAYKKLSQRFHGTKSNKKKQAKMNARLEQRSRHQGSDLQRDII